jgi:[acyl-carrier-protein] S-malonyltransferase
VGQHGGALVKAVLLFPGQGTQQVGMGKDLAERFPAARAMFQRADSALGTSLSKLMWEGPESDLTLTHNAQPAILAHALAVNAVVGRHLSPVAAAGHSLGEYAAYAALGALTLDDAVRLVRRRGELMFRAGTERPGTMAAVLGLAGETVAEICARESRKDEVVVPANLNAPDQTVISGDPAAVERAGQAMKAAGARRVIALRVSGAFHSPLMAPAASGLARELDLVSIGDPAAPVIANASAEAVEDGETARRLLAQQLIAPVRWVESMRAAAETAKGATFVELGPGGVLGGLVKRILPGAAAVSLGTADEVQAFLDRGQR